MKFNLMSKNKKITGVVLASALVMGSLGTYVAFAANNKDAVPKDTVVSVPVSTGSLETSAIAQGTIQYSKDVYNRADGSQNTTYERWYNPETKEYRSDLKEYNTNHQLNRYQSTYYVKGSNDLIIVQRDANGNPVSGTDTKRTDKSPVFEKLDMNNLDFNSIKSNFTGSQWTSIGTEKTPDGKTLNKLTRPIYKSYINDTTQADMQIIEYLDNGTGLPVKEELYEDSTGKYKIFSTDNYEYKYVSDDGTIFKTDGITLTQVNEPGNTTGK